ncbi:MAG: hypothetical protein IPM59_06515 [Chloracidobacterium sp.]|nr:hypothetical protein [Chloracidobacterium sp.]
MSGIDDLKAALGEQWIPTIYEARVRSDRTRSYDLKVPKKENAAEIQYTLLGIELKVGRRRFACPDLATARYLRVFARLGCSSFAVPYDISRISPIADELETAWQRTLLALEPNGMADMRQRAVKAIRDEIAAIGPGDAMPLFDRETRQRKV